MTGHTALHLAATQDNVRVVAHLLQQPSVDVNALDDDYGMTPLHCAVRTTALRVIKIMCRLAMSKADVNVNAQLISGGPIPRIKGVTLASLCNLQEGDTALHLAVRFGLRTHAFEIAKRLCALRHLTASSLNDDRESALALARETWEHSFKQWAPKRSTQETREDFEAPTQLLDVIAGHPDFDRTVDTERETHEGLRNTLNALLIGGTLLAGTTFGGFLQPPFGTTFTYHAQAVKWFWLFNSTSFYYAMHTLLVTLRSLMPFSPLEYKPMSSSRVQIVGGAHFVRLRIQVLVSTIAMVLSVLSGVAAFAAAGVANLPPSTSAIMLATTIVGGVLIVPSAINILQQELSSLAQPSNRDDSQSFNIFIIFLLLVFAPCLIPFTLPFTLILKTNTMGDSIVFQVYRESCQILLMIVVAIVVFVVAIRS